MLASPPKPKLPDGWVYAGNEENNIELYYHIETMKIVGSLEKVFKYHQQMQRNKNRTETIDITLNDENGMVMYTQPTPGVPIAASAPQNESNLDVELNNDVESCASALTDLSKNLVANAVTPSAPSKRRRITVHSQNQDLFQGLLTQPCETNIVRVVDDHSSVHGTTNLYKNIKEGNTIVILNNDYGIPEDTTNGVI